MDLQGIVGVVAYIAFFYTAMTTSARILGYSENVVVNAFITKMIFTVVDEQIRAKKVEKNNTK